MQEINLCSRIFVSNLPLFAGHECRSITVGSTEHSTFVLPKLLLRAVSITEVPALEEIRQLLQQVVDG